MEAGPSSAHAESVDTQDTPEDILRADLAMSDDEPETPQAESPTFTNSSSESS